MLKAEIHGIGMCWPHEPDELGRTWTASSWWMEGGDFPGHDVAAGLVGGWTMAELALVWDLARAIGHDEALEKANAYRQVPARPAPAGDGEEA